MASASAVIPASVVSQVQVLLVTAVLVARLEHPVILVILVGQASAALV